MNFKTDIKLFDSKYILYFQYQFEIILNNIKMQLYFWCL